MSVRDSSDGESMQANPRRAALPKGASGPGKDGESNDLEFEVQMISQKDSGTQNNYHECTWALSKVPQELNFVDYTGDDRRRYHLVVRSSIRSKLHSMDKRVSKLQQKNSLMESEITSLTEGCNRIASIREQQHSFIRHLIDSIRQVWPTYQAPSLHDSASIASSANATNPPPPPPPPSNGGNTNPASILPSSSLPAPSNGVIMASSPTSASALPVGSNIYPSNPRVVANTNNTNNNAPLSGIPQSSSAPQHQPVAPTSAFVPTQQQQPQAASYNTTPPIMPPPPNKPPLSQQFPRVAVAVAAHEKLEPSELPVSAGDIIEVQRVDGSGWAWGRLLWSPTLRGAPVETMVGWFPAANVRDIQ